MPFVAAACGDVLIVAAEGQHSATGEEVCDLQVAGPPGRMSCDPLPSNGTNGVLLHADDVQNVAWLGVPSLRRLATLIIDTVWSIRVVAKPEADRPYHAKQPINTAHRTRIV